MFSCAVLAWISLASFLTPSAHALDPALAPSAYNRRVFTVADGLPHAHVLAIGQTADGYLWLGTESGLVRFDGVSFSSPRGVHADLIRARGVWRLFNDRSDGLWIVGNGQTGLTRFDGRGFAVVETKLASNELHALTEDAAGTLWIGGNAGLARRRGGNLLPPLEHAGDIGDVRALCVAPDGSLWIGSVQRGLLHVTDGQLAQPALDAAALGARITSLAADAHGAIWIGTDGAGVNRLAAGALSTVTEKHGLSSNHVRTLLVDRHGSLWVGTRTGLDRVRQGKDSARVENLTETVRQPAGLVSALFEDREGNLWAGTGNGLVRLNEGRLSPLPMPELAGNTSALATTQTRDGALWIGTDQGLLLRHHEGRWTRYTTADGLCVDHVLSLAEDQRGRLWIGGQGTVTARTNLCHWQAGQFVPSRSAELGNAEFIRALAIDTGGRLWAGTHRLLRVDEDRLVPTPYPGEAKWIYALTSDGAGGLWLGITGAVLHRSKSGDWVRRAVADAALAVVSQGADAAWIGTSQGLAYWSRDELTPFTLAQGFIDDPVVRAVMDAQQNLWACTPRGVLRIGAAGLARQPGRKEWAAPFVRYQADDGMGAFFCESGAGASNGFLGQDGLPWFLTNGGLLSVQPRGPGERIPLTTVVERLVVDGQEQLLDGAIALGPGTGDARIDYTAPAFTAPRRIGFRYRLDPFDRDWVSAGERRSAFYTHLPPGKYRFVVAARDDESNWVGKPAELAFTLAPRFFQTTWFQLLVAALLAATVGLFFRLRIRQMAIRHALILAERSRIARDIHDTLAQGFTAISIHAGAALDALKEAPDDARKSLLEVRQLSKASLHDAHQAVWDLRSGSLATGGLPEALSKLVDQMSHRVPIRLKTVGEIRPIPFTHESALLRVGQEAITNAVRHANASRIDLEIAFEPGQVVLRIRDDGVGFDPAAARDLALEGHFGLVGMKERIEALGGKWTVNSVPGRTQIVALLVTRDT